MTVSVTCNRCHELITAEDEDELVAQVEVHARDHGGAHGQHVPSREHILAHVRPHNPKEQ
jgi:hypothetical protein